MKKLGEIEKTQDFLGWNINYLPPCLSAGKKILIQGLWVKIKLCMWLCNPLLKGIAKPMPTRFSHLEKRGHLRILKVPSPQPSPTHTKVEIWELSAGR